MHVGLLLCATILAFVEFKPVTSVSVEQLEKLAKTMRKNCLQKIDTTNEKVDGFARGEFPDDENLACYANCIMKTLRSFKNGAIDYAMMAKQVEMTMPPEMVDRVKLAIEKCKREYTGDPCTVSYEYLKCYYEADPEAFIFP